MFNLRNRYLILFATGVLILFSFTPEPISAQDSGEETESGGEILRWDVDVGTVKVPQTLKAAEELREKNMYKFPEGTGAYFGFVSELEPWDYLDLNLEYPEDAWSSPLPYYFSMEPQLNAPFTIGGTCSIYDATGHLVIREYSLTEPPHPAFGGTSWFVMGDISRCWEDWMDEAVEFQEDYFPAETVGIRYFLSQVHLRGIIGGERMQDLLKQVNAKEVSIQRTYRDERMGIFFIPPTAEEWNNWIGEMYVWINMKNWVIERHQVDYLYGREYCQYYNQLWDVQPDISLFYLEWLPIRILDLLAEEYGLETTDEGPPVPDEYIEQDQWIRISGSGQNEEEEEKDEGSQGDGEESESSG